MALARAAIGRDYFLDDAEPDDYGSEAPGMVGRRMVTTPSGFVLQDSGLGQKTVANGVGGYRPSGAGTVGPRIIDLSK